ncbi:hypothetical protein [Nocardioides sp. R-C-SC26]|uniref:hypothetical protein n=1 Tax=Nocardioides sp. R-C-SC26 TaxID=2870414 RepID=UPI001E506C02|nr:hypothetical protein [Nocardioides sp. R-C-SC26]
MSNFAPERTEYGNDDTRWLRDALRAGTHGITIDGSLFTSNPAGVLIPSGTHISELGGPYNATTEEVQTLTEGGSGLTSFTITFDGQTTAAIDDDATAAQVQAALEGLSTVGEGNVVVTGGPLATGPFTVKFIGDLANTNVPQMTTTPTGGTGSVTVATTTAGGSAIDSPSGSGKTEGHLRNRLRVKPGARYLVAVVDSGQIDRRYLPAGDHDAAAESQLTAIAYIN